jgi:hypothetical protein
MNLALRRERGDDGVMPGSSDEFGEFDTDEATFDVMMARAEPAEITSAPERITVTVDDVDDTRFIVTMPTTHFVSVGRSVSGAYEAVARTPLETGRLAPARHREAPRTEVLAS